MISTNLENVTMGDLLKLQQGNCDAMGFLFSKMECFRQSPLTLKQFVESSPQYESFFPHSIKTFESFQKDLPRATYFTGCVGKGSTVMTFTLFLFKAYLFTKLIAPYKYFGHAPSTSYKFAIVCSARSRKFVGEALRNVMDNTFPNLFTHDINNLQEDQIGYEMYPDEDNLIRFHWLQDGTKKTLDVLRLWVDREGSMLGCTPVYCLCPHLELTEEEVVEDELLKLIHKAWARVDARTWTERFISGICFEMSPKDVETSALENYFYYEFPKVDGAVTYRFGPYYNLFPDKYTALGPLNIVDYVDLETESLTSQNPNVLHEHIRPVPLEDIGIAKKDIKSYIRDFLGLPTSCYLENRRRQLKEIVKHIKQVNADLRLVNGKLYLGIKDTDITCSLEDIYD